MRHQTDDYIKKHHQPLTKISVDGATPPITNTSEETDIIADLPLNRGILSDAGYEVVNSKAPSRGRQYDQPTCKLILLFNVKTSRRLIISSGYRFS